jgi:sugar O-acyltransferase (sialic acid O-acetyltransferase NeuD family)
MKKIIFWGATGQAKVLRECISYYDVSLVALFDNNSYLISPFDKVPLKSGDAFKIWIQQQDSPESIMFLVAIGGDRGRDRLEIHDYLKSFGLIPYTAIHPTSFVAKDAQIGEGSQVLAHSSICVDTVIGRECIINTSSSVDHECKIGDGVHIGPGANVAGLVTIGKFALIGTGATILPRIKIGKGSVIGAGAVVTKDVPDFTVVTGNPAKKTQIRKKVLG